MRLVRLVPANARRLYRKVALKWGRAGRVDRRRLERFVKDHSNMVPHAAAPKEPRIGIVVPCYGHARYLAVAFASIANQTRVPDHVVFVDDCSPDDTSVILRRLVEQSSIQRQRFALVRNDSNLGQCATINQAVELVRSDVVIVLNDDDYLMHDAVERVRSLCALYPDVRLFGAKAVYFYGDEYLANHRKLVTESLLSDELHVRLSLPVDALAFRTGREVDVCHSGSAFYKDAWREVGGYSTKWRERVIGFADRDFQIRVNALFPVAVVENAAFAFWRVGSSVDQGLFS